MAWDGDNRARAKPAAADSFNGTWEYTQGTGRYSEIRRSVVYEGRGSDAGRAEDRTRLLHAILFAPNAGRLGAVSAPAMAR